LLYRNISAFLVLASVDSALRREVINVRILLLHDTQHDLPAHETALAANSDELRSIVEAEA
jgi:hypothetical protein